MFAKAGIKKKLLMLALAMAMAASLVCGTLFVRADAEAVNAEDLITVSGGATVTAAQRYTLKNAVGDLAAGTQVGPAGLYVSSGRENGSISGTQEYYEIALNGIFTGSVHINWQAPNEGFWEQHKEVAFRVQSISDPAAAFEFRMGGQWQQYGYVTYEWQGETLWRSQNTYYSDANPAASDYSYTQALSTDNGFAQWAPMIGNMDNADNHDYVGYFGVELEEDGTVNVAAVGAHDGNHREVVASFCEDPETFEPITDAERGSEPNLPKIDLSAGYTVTIRVQNYHNIGGWTADSMADFLLVSVEESETGDPSQPENGGTVYTFDGATSESAPQFYTNWQTIPVIRAEGYEETDYSYIGAEIELPRATATVGGVVSDFAGTITVTDPSGAQTQVTDGIYEVKAVGEHTVRYAQGSSYFEFGFYAYDKPFAVEDVVTAEGAALSYGEDVRGLAGITVSSEGGAYSGTLAGSFSGNMSVDFEFPHQFNEQNTGNGAQFVFTVYDAEGNAAFDIVYENTGGWYTGVYVRMGDEIRSWIEDGSYDGWDGAKGTMFYTVPTGDRCLVYPGTGIMYSEADKYGTLQLAWEGRTLCVRVTDRNNNMVTIARFDGSEPYTARELDVNGALVLDMNAERRYGLPMMDGTDAEGADLTKGFGIGFSSNNAQLPVTFLSVNGIAFEGRENITTDYTHSVSLLADRAYADGSDIYVAQGQSAGTVRRVYSYAFMGAVSQYAGSWGITHAIYEDDFSEFSSTDLSVGEHAVEIALDEGGAQWTGQTETLFLHVETPYTLSFEENGGESAADVIYSDSTRFLIEAPEISRLFWQFGGWYTDSGLTEEWDGSADSISGSMTLYAKWNDVTPPTIVFADGISASAETVAGRTFTVSKSDVIAGDDAQGSVTLTVRYRVPGSDSFTVLEGESVTLTAAEGIYEIEYTADDGAGNDTAVITRTVTAVARTAPVITVGEGAAEGYEGFPVAVADASASDMEGNALTDIDVTVTDENGRVYETTDGTFLPDKTGVYTVSYCAADASGVKGFASYKVTVVADTEAPVIRVDFSDRTVERGTVIAVPSAAATDNAYGDVEVNVSVTFGTQTITLGEGNTFTADTPGTYVVRYTAEDGAGNAAETVVVRITVPAEGGASGGCSGTAYTAAGAVSAVLVAAAAAAAAICRRKAK